MSIMSSIQQIYSLLLILRNLGCTVLLSKNGEDLEFSKVSLNIVNCLVIVVTPTETFSYLSDANILFDKLINTILIITTNTNQF